MSNANAKRIAEELALGRTGFNLDVLSRYMTPAELRTFNDTYNQHIKRVGFSANRFVRLAEEITQEEKQMVAEYLDELSNDTCADIEKRHNLRPNTLRGKMAIIALKYFYQNKVKI